MGRGEGGREPPQRSLARAVPRVGLEAETSDRLMRRFGPAALAFPGLALMVLFFALPVGVILGQSFFDPGFTLKFYARMAAGPEYALVFWISIKIALLSAFFSMIAGYPVAYLLVKAAPTLRAIMMAFILLPFWTNILVRCYAWMLVLQTKGLLNSLLVGWLHLLDQPLALMFNLPGVIIGMVHYLLPINILILYSAMKGIDLKLVQAAQGLGANPLRAFLTVFVPLSLPAVRAAALLTFVLALGFFVTPALLGGRGEITVAMLVSTYFSEVLDWGFGSALATVLLAITTLGLCLHFALERRRAGLVLQ